MTERVTLEHLIVGRNGLDALLRTDPEDADAEAWWRVIGYLNREIVRRGGYESINPDLSQYTEAELRVLYYEHEESLAPADWLAIEGEYIERIRAVPACGISGTEDAKT